VPAAGDFHFSCTLGIPTPPPGAPAFVIYGCGGRRYVLLDESTPITVVANLVLAPSPDPWCRARRRPYLQAQHRISSIPQLLDQAPGVGRPPGKLITESHRPCLPTFRQPPSVHIPSTRSGGDAYAAQTKSCVSRRPSAESMSRISRRGCSPATAATSGWRGWARSSSTELTGAPGMVLPTRRGCPSTPCGGRFP